MEQKVSQLIAEGFHLLLEKTTNCADQLEEKHGVNFEVIRLEDFEVKKLEKKHQKHLASVVDDNTHGAGQ